MQHKWFKMTLRYLSYVFWQTQHDSTVKTQIAGTADLASTSSNLIREMLYLFLHTRIIDGHLQDQNSRTSRSNKVVKWSSHKVSQSQHHEVTKIVTLLQVQVCDASQSWHSHAATPAIETTPTIWLHPASQTNQQNNFVPWGVQSCLLICKYMYWHVLAYV